jgi:hypothetical protein
MLSATFILRLEAILQAPIAAGIRNSDARFVSIKLPMSPAKDIQQSGKYGPSARLGYRTSADTR